VREIAREVRMAWRNAVMTLFGLWAWRLWPAAAVFSALALLSRAPCFAQSASPCDQANTASDSGAAAPPAGFWDRDRLTGDWGGLRNDLANRGITLTLVEKAETLGNVSGGVRTGFIFEGLLTAGLGVDLDKAFGWCGGLFYVDAYQIHGHGLSAGNLHNLFTVSGIEANRSTRLHDLYLEQSLWHDALSVRLGQIAADDEFIISQYGANFVNAMFGWPGLPSNDLPAGGPIYPLSTPGLRVKYASDKAWSFMSAVFNGNPAGPVTSGNRNLNPQLRDPSGTDFNFNSDAFVIAEAGYAFVPGADAPGLPASYKLGAWYHSGKFQDQRFDTTGLSLASPASTGVPRNHVNDFSVYGVVDQMIWRRPGTDDRGLAGFLRAMGAPDDRNPVAFYVDGGLNVLGPFAGRDQDIAGLAVAYGRMSRALKQLDQDFAAFTGVPRPVHDYEAVLELTYQAPVAGWCALQPDLQYVLHPGGHASNPADPGGGTAIKDALVLGVRATITF
jgi:porin